uniref:NAC070 n=1 Tax=Arundo donax TaxID=35708 RepID=A0A0A9GZ99_ARUDO
MNSAWKDKVIPPSYLSRRTGSYAGFSTRVGQQLPSHPQRVAATILAQPQLHCLP